MQETAFFAISGRLTGIPTDVPVDALECSLSKKLVDPSAVIKTSLADDQQGGSSNQWKIAKHFSNETDEYHMQGKFYDWTNSPGICGDRRQNCCEVYKKQCYVSWKSITKDTGTTGKCPQNRSLWSFGHSLG